MEQMMARAPKHFLALAAQVRGHSESRYLAVITQWFALSEQRSPAVQGATTICHDTAVAAKGTEAGCFGSVGRLYRMHPTSSRVRWEARERRAQIAVLVRLTDYKHALHQASHTGRACSAYRW